MLEWVSELSIEGRAAVIDAAFPNVFSTEEGLIVAGIILDDLYFMDEARGEGQQALNNYAKVFLKRCGQGVAVRAIEAWLRVTSREVRKKEEIV